MASLVNRWPLTENANDVVGSLNLTNNGTVTFGADGASFNGSSQWLSGTKTVPATFTLSTWIKVVSMPATALCPMTWGETNGANCVGFYLQNGGNEYCFESNGLCYQSTAATPTYSSTTHTNIIVTYDGSTVRYFRGGTEISGAQIGGTTTRSTNFSIGRYGVDTSTNFYLNGAEKDARIYNGPLAPAEITAIVAAGPNPGTVTLRLAQCMGGF